jgi:hypothetical protein
MQPDYRLTADNRLTNVNLLFADAGSYTVSNYRKVAGYFALVESITNDIQKPSNLFFCKIPKLYS